MSIEITLVTLYMSAFCLVLAWAEYSAERDQIDYFIESMTHKLDVIERTKAIKKQQSIEKARWGHLESPAYLRDNDQTDEYEAYKSSQIARMRLEADDVNDALWRN